MFRRLGLGLGSRARTPHAHARPTPTHAPRPRTPHAHAGLTLERGRLVGSPERLNLFTLDGDVLRLDLELEARCRAALVVSSTIGRGVRPEP